MTNFKCQASFALFLQIQQLQESRVWQCTGSKPGERCGPWYIQVSSTWRSLEKQTKQNNVKSNQTNEPIPTNESTNQSQAGSQRSKQPTHQQQNKQKRQTNKALPKRNTELGIFMYFPPIRAMRRHAMPHACMMCNFCTTSANPPQQHAPVCTKITGLTAPQSQSSTGF